LQRNGKRHSAIQLKREGFEGMKTRIREKIGQRRLGVEAGNHNQGWKQSRFRQFWTLVLPVFGLGGAPMRGTVNAQFWSERNHHRSEHALDDHQFDFGLGGRA
jgi:hypothetical protein